MDCTFGCVYLIELGEGRKALKINKILKLNKLRRLLVDCGGYRSDNDVLHLEVLTYNFVRLSQKKTN